ncbi:patatin-like phospholipase family protein [Ramlibacter rhizophilus]|uniref:Patatin-like phospholipase family protein n=1 Tax=Ramlibacter rhizophilus TaxID=1781167 RepID=A0A4Z0BH64_9BURK|nr:patatin-like phospholipase family protein [Ramlibacter rhizophilus]TFY98130.1 patatin-like phospholipase family protein [Ramlibacter rhizophilus]
MKPANSNGRKTISLALQGGGSHGAFTWGVLDSLLADGRLDVKALSGTSAGALNAVALASGLSSAAAGTDPAQAARECLAQVWEDIGHLGALGELHARVGRALWGGLGLDWSPSTLWTQAWSGLLSPYQANPLDLNPLRDLLARRIDFEGIRQAESPRVFVSATHVSTGKAVIFQGPQVNADAVLASACLPTLFRAVEIDGQAYWDGGFSVNPALTPLIDCSADPDIVIVQINPLRRQAVPRSAAEIRDRMNELSFNASLLTQVRTIDFVNRLLAEGTLAPGSRKLVRMHRIDGGDAMGAYSASTKARTDPGLIRELFALGQSAAQDWLRDNFALLGQRSTIDVQRDYLDDTRLNWPKASAPAGPPTAHSAFRPWLARLFRLQQPR